MTPETPDDVAVPHFENRLWRELAQAHDRFRRSGAPPEHRRRPARGSRRYLLLGVGAIAAAAALIVGVVVAGSGDGSGVRTGDRREETGPADTPPTTGGEPEDQSLAGRIAAASEQAGTDYVLHIVQDMTNGPGDTETWGDGRSGAVRTLQKDESGAPSFDSGPATAPPLDAQVPPNIRQDVPPNDPSIPRRADRRVDHCFREYVEGETWDLPATDPGDGIAERLRVGSLFEDGTDVVDGRELIRLVETLGSIGADDIDGSRQATTTTVVDGPGATTETTETTETTVGMDEVLGIELVDPETYRPVRRIGYPGSSAEYVMTYEYLPRTPETLAQIAVPVPEGFTQVQDLRGDGERADAGCL